MYKRNTKKAQKLINKKWQETKGIVNYVGEWHTHPNMEANPSHTDISSLKEISKIIHGALPGTILIIMGKNEKINLIVQYGNIVEMRMISEKR